MLIRRSSAENDPVTCLLSIRQELDVPYCPPLGSILDMGSSAFMHVTIMQHHSLTDQPEEEDTTDVYADVHRRGKLGGPHTDAGLRPRQNL
jgi:hypothetical protein